MNNNTNNQQIQTNEKNGALSDEQLDQVTGGMAADDGDETTPSCRKTGGVPTEY